jgi:predicted ferric reductase
MSSIVAAGGGPSAYWYLTRSTGAVAMLLLTASVVLGIADVRRYATTSWPRFVIDGLHRNVSLLAVAFVALHIITSVLDGFAPISITAAVIPFISSYRPFWLGLGAVSFDLLLALVITSVLRARISQRTWRVTHWLAYACWPIALVHGFGTGSDARSSWLLLLSVACTIAVALAILSRALPGFGAHPRLNGAALGAVGAFALFLVVWLPSGPLAKDWARRAGTPASLLPHARTSASSSHGSAAGAGSASSGASAEGTGSGESER